MENRKIIVGLDIGTTKVCTLVGALNLENEFEIIGYGSYPSFGLKKGSVVNIENTIRSIKSSIEHAQLMAGVDIKNATIGIAGNHIYSFNGQGVVAVKDKEITQEDVDRAIEAAKAVLIPSDREVLHVIPQEFKVDKISGIKNPIGMLGTRLEVNVHVVTGVSSLIRNLVRCVEQSGISVDDVILQPLASSRSILTPEEKEIGTVMIDIGGGTTDVVLWKDGSIIYSQILPVGGNQFTNDLAVALKIPYNEAEKIKLEYGSVLTNSEDREQVINVRGIPGTKSREVPLKFISSVLEARADEIFKVISQLLEEKGLKDEINGGYVLTGGGSLVRGLPELAEYIFERAVKLGFPIPFGGMTRTMQNPQYSTVLGLLLEASKDFDIEKEKNIKINKDKITANKIGFSLKNVFKELF